MIEHNQKRRCRRRPRPAEVLFLLASLAFALMGGCSRNSPIAIAVIPRTSGSMLWEPEHGGAQATAHELGARIYWNAPTREDDIEGQIALIQRISAENYQGLVLAPDQSRALITPVRRAMQHGLSVVIVGSPLSIPPGGRLSYVLNDDEAGGRIAGERLATLLHGKGSVAILGVDSDIAGIVTRARSLETFLAASYPDIRVIKRTGSFNVPHEQQVAEEVLKTNPELDAVVALTGTSMLGATSALGDVLPRRSVVLISFDPDSLSFENPNLDSVILENTQRMGAEAVRQVVARSNGQSVPAVMRVEPLLVTRENVNSAEVRQLTSMDWRPEPLAQTWRLVP
jgi:ribose transport system substrate-binding protein